MVDGDCGIRSTGLMACSQLSSRDVRRAEGFPIALLVAKATDVALSDLVERQGGNFGRHLVPGFGHRFTPCVVSELGARFRSAARSAAATAAARAAGH